jgi:2-oxoglutarate ferredoxin oxidoreductase subunit alpha
MVYGAASTGKKVMTSSSSPGMSLMQEGVSYLAGAELPCLLMNVARGGPGLGTIQPSQADYFQSTKGGGHGDYRLIVLAPASVQEMFDFAFLGFELAFKYRNPVLILSDGLIGQMMEKVEMCEQMPRATNFDRSWTLTGKPDGQERNIVTSLDLDASRQEVHNQHLQEKYRKCAAAEVRYELFDTDDADYLFVAYGSSARICQKAIQLGREEGIKIGLLRPITLWPYPAKPLAELAPRMKGILAVEQSAGQMVEDVRLSVGCGIPIEHFGRMGGMIPTPEEVLENLKKLLIKK